MDASGKEIHLKMMMDAYQELQVRELAFNTAVNMIANAVGMCEFKTFQGGEVFKGPEYWRWNFAPNKNQNSSAFLHQMVWQLYHDNEALVIERAGQLLVAKSFAKKEYATKENLFSSVQVNGMAVNSNYHASNVLYLRLSQEDMRSVIWGINAAYAKLIQSAQKSYQWSAGRHGKLSVGAMRPGDPDGSWMETFNTLATNLARPFLENENGVIPEFDGFRFEELGGSNGRSPQTTRDIRALIDDVYELTAKAFQIPAPLLKGEVQETQDAIDNFLTFCIDPLCDQISEEINRKIYGYEGFIAGDYLKIDTSKIKHFDLFTSATSVDKLISSGAYSINNVRVAAGDTPINETWADKHFITKNYAEIKDLLELGGDSNGT